MPARAAVRTGDVAALAGTSPHCCLCPTQSAGAMGACRFLLLAHCTGVLRLLEVGHPRHGEIPRLSDAPARADRPAPLVELVMGGVPVDFGELIFVASEDET